MTDVDRLDATRFLCDWCAQSVGEPDAKCLGPVGSTSCPGSPVEYVRADILAATDAERNRYRDALEEIASDLGTPGKPEWRCAMEALGLDADAAERAWHS